MASAPSRARRVPETARYIAHGYRGEAWIIERVWAGWQARRQRDGRIVLSRTLGEIEQGLADAAECCPGMWE